MTEQNQPPQTEQSETPPLPTASEDETLAWVGDDTQRARQIADREHESSEPRQSLLDKLKSKLS